MQFDSYETIARHYDLRGMDWFARANGERLLNTLTNQGLRAGDRVLDAGCGTGTLALLLASAGYAVTGMDLSEPMLRAARAKPNASTVTWLQGDVTSFECQDRFSAIVCVADVLNHLEDGRQWDRAFDRFFAQLLPGGLVFLDVMTLRGFERLDAYTTLDRADQTVIVGVVYEPRARRSTMKLTSFTPVPDGNLWERVSDTIVEWGRPVGEILDRAMRSGFEGLERVWENEGDWEDSDRLRLIGRRPLA